MQDLAASPHLFLPSEALYLRFWVGAVIQPVVTIGKIGFRVAKGT